jgi:hypothetical protein
VRARLLLTSAFAVLVFAVGAAAQLQKDAIDKTGPSAAAIAKGVD